MFRQPNSWISGPSAIAEFDATSRDHHIGPRVQRGGDREGAEISVDARQRRGQRRAAEHFADSAAAKVFDFVGEVVAFDHRDLEVDARLVERRRQSRPAGFRVHAPRIGDDLDALLRDLASERLHDHRDEIGGVTGVGPLGLHAGQDRHGDLGEIVEHEIIDAAVSNDLQGALGTVAPKARAATDAHDILHRGLTPPSIRARAFR